MQTAIIQILVAASLLAIAPGGASELSRAIGQIGCSLTAGTECAGPAAVMIQPTAAATIETREDGRPGIPRHLTFMGIPLEGNS